MLVLSRKVGEEFVVPQCELVVTVLEIRGDKVRLGISGPRRVEVHRREVWERIEALRAVAPVPVSEATAAADRRPE